MACGCPVIATKADGNEEFCVDGETCLLVDQSEERLIADATMAMLEDEGLASRLSAGGISVAGKYSWENVMSSLANILNLHSTENTATGISPL
jgi:glycosyltransferase involved in cell wall biosynthesis